MNIHDFMEEAKKVKDPRRRYGNLRHKLIDIIVIGLLTIMNMGEDFVDMEEFGKSKITWLKKFLELPNGIPDSDTFRRVYERLNPKELSKCLNNWQAKDLDVNGKTVNIDGKTIRGSKNEEHKAYHVVSAWVAENQITLGEIKTEEKSNEITAVPLLLDTLDIEGSIVTADAMSCQKVIVEKIAEKKADYVIGLKGNQETLLNNVKLYFENYAEYAEKTTTLEKDHGRIEKREYFLEPDETDWIPQKSDWANFNAIGMVRTTVETNGTKHTNIRYYITSVRSITDFAYAVRSHWSIENQLHWFLDVVYREDAAKAKKDNSPLNMNILRKASLSFWRAVNMGRMSVRKKMFKAALNFDWFFGLFSLSK
jgi:predicted transposase YbfD/YdcC